MGGLSDERDHYIEDRRDEDAEALETLMENAETGFWDAETRLDDANERHYEALMWLEEANEAVWDAEWDLENAQTNDEWEWANHVLSMAYEEQM